MTCTPYKVFAALSRFLGLPEEKERIRRAIRFSSFKEMKKQEKAGGFVEARPDGKAKFFRAGKAGAWRADLTESQIAKMIEAHREIMTKFGYLSPRGEPLE
jgi:Sulfotransferase domain